MEENTILSAIIFIPIIGFIIAILACSIKIVKQTEIGIVERFLKYNREVSPGINIIIPFIERIVPINIQQQETHVTVGSKSKDDVSVDLDLSIQFRVDEDKIKTAAYKLEDPYGQMKSYIYDVVRAKIPKMAIDSVFEEKDMIQNDINEILKTKIHEYGFIIENVLVTDINIDANVLKAMNRKNAALREADAATHEAKAEAIKVVASAEAEAKANELFGTGIANQRKEIMNGFRESITDFLGEDPKLSEQEVLNFIVKTQHIDALKDMAANENSKIIFANSDNMTESLLKAQEV